MPVCQLCGKRCRVDRFDSRLLEGDVFHDYYCPECSNTREGTFERHQLSWQTVIHLVLYHLQQQQCKGSESPPEPRFFRWKEDICGFIEKKWDDLIPQKNPGVSWQNSVSSVLSAHHEVFLNGLEAKGETGWWALRVMEPPRPKQTPNLGKRRRSCSEEEVEIKSEAGSIDLVLEEDQQQQEQEEPIQQKDSNTSELIKRQLLSRLLSEDSSLLQQALSKVKEDNSYKSPDTNGNRARALSTRAPPVENELLRILARIKNPDVKMKRLRRKLLARRERRRAGIDLFDLDAFIYNYLKDPKPFNAQGGRVDSITVKLVHNLPNSGGNEGVQIAVKTPYEANKYLSMRCKALGISGCGKFPFELISPFSGRPLPEYILRCPDAFAKSAKGRLLNSLNRLFRNSEYSATIDYLHMRREHVSQLNRLLSTFFYPGIETAECVDYPDYSILAVYNKWLIVGAALLDPDGYLSHFFVHPEFSNAGIGTRLLHLILQSAPPRDITLHVSATNPAMLLYNRFGFKPEQYIINHYDKYYRMAEQVEECRAMSALLPYSKNAFLIRLRR